MWHTIGSANLHTLDEAREIARTAMKAIKLGTDRAGPQSFQSVAEEWLKRHVDAKGIITSKEKRRYLDKHILPEWGGRDFTSIKRIDVAKLLDTIEDIVRASEAYLLADRFGRTGDFLAKVKVILELHDKAATRFFKELFADHSAVSDAGVYAHYLIENNFKASQLGKDAPGLDAFLNLLRAFHIACNTSIKQLNDASSQARNEDAWAMWVSRLAEILKETKSPVSDSKDSGDKGKTPKPPVFVMFVWELQKCLPTECRRHTELEVALSDALSLR